MRNYSLGKLFEVSALTLGGGGIGQVWGETSQDEAIATVCDAYCAGIRLFDMAPLYGDGEAERVMGWLLQTGIRRIFVLRPSVWLVRFQESRLKLDCATP